MQSKYVTTILQEPVHLIFATNNAPTAVTVRLLATQPTCTTGAAIAALGWWRTAGYFYELRLPDNTVVVAFKKLRCSKCYYKLI
jgi:hypothetical protein